MIIIKNNKINKKGLIITIIMVLFMVCFMGTISTVSADDVDEDSTVSDEQVDNEIKNEIDEVSAKLREEPAINSRRYAVYDRISKKVIYGKNEDVKSAMASTTKIMTATVVLENADLNQEVVVSKKAGWTGGSRLGLKSGDKTTIKDLLYGLMLRSGNDAAVALAEYVGGSVEGFAEKMNEKAKDMGLENTHFITPHGLDMDNHYTTAFELAKMADYALNIDKFASIVNTKNIGISINGRSKNLTNTNELLGNLYGVNGVKTGFTNGANRCLVTSVNRDGMNIITVVLGADTKKDRSNDSIKLIEYAYTNYEIYDMKEIIHEKYEEWKRINENRIVVVRGKRENLTTCIEELENYYIPVKKIDKEKINVKIFNISELNAPVHKGDYVGKLCVYIDDEKIVELTISANISIGKLEFIDYLKSYIINNINNMQMGL